MKQIVANSNNIPRVMVRDPETGKVLYVGYYFEMPEVYSCIAGESKIRRFIIHYRPGCDWGFDNEGPSITEVKPPYEIELVDEYPSVSEELKQAVDDFNDISLKATTSLANWSDEFTLDKCGWHVEFNATKA